MPAQLVIIWRNTFMVNKMKCLYGFLLVMVIIAGCKNDTSDSSDNYCQYPPPYIVVSTGYLLKPQYSLSMLLGKYGEANLNYYMTESDYEGFRNYIKTQITPYLQNLSLDEVNANAALVSTTASFIDRCVKMIDEYGLEGLMAIREYFFYNAG
jgi:hypothetical protein